MNYGCKDGLPHDIQVRRDPKTGELLDFTQEIHEICVLCGRKWKWNKAARGRVDNPEYVRVHQRQFAQPTGPTAKLFHQLYGDARKFDLTKKGTNEK
jgi:hypothetical protein